jgi:hypothetical protein
MRPSELSRGMRLSIVISVVWILSVFALSRPWDSSGVPEAFIFVGLIPVAIFWGVIWIAKGKKDSDT